MSIRAQFTRDDAGNPKFTDTTLRAVAKSIKARGGPGSGCRIPRALHEFAEDKLISETHKIIATRGDMSYSQAADLVHKMHPHLLALHFCEAGDTDLDVTLADGEGDEG